MSNDLYAKATAGVYAEVINQVYDSLDKRIREAVSNAFDAKATEVNIEVYQKGAGRLDKIVIYDNGEGMSVEDLQRKYISLGGGDNYNDPNTIGRIGIGALSVFGLGDTIAIETRKKGSDRVLAADLDLSKIKSADKHATLLEEMKLGVIKGERTATESDDEHYTRIVITHLSEPARRAFQSEEEVTSLKDRLERILPIPFRNDEPLLAHLSSDLRAKIIRDNKHVIDVTLHVPHLDIKKTKLYRRTAYSVGEAQIESLIPVYPFNLDGGKNKNLSVYGCLYINKGKALPRAWQGINARVKNVAIERNTFFGYEKDAAARVRIGGELYIDYIDENNAIQSSRSGFAVENSDYKLVASYMEASIVRAINQVRKSTDIDSLVKKLVRKIEKLYEMCDRVSKLEDDKTCADSFQALTDESVEVGDVNVFSIKDKLRYELEKIDIDAEVIWSPVIPSSYYVERDDDGYYTVQVNQMYESFLFDVAGNTIEYILGRCGNTKPLIIKNGRTIYFNLESSILMTDEVTKLDIGFLKAVLILYLNYLRCDGNAKDLYKLAIEDLSV